MSKRAFSEEGDRLQVLYHSSEPHCARQCCNVRT